MATPTSQINFESLLSRALTNVFAGKSVTESVEQSTQSEFERLCQEGVLANIKEKTVPILVGGLMIFTLVAYGGYSLGRTSTKASRKRKRTTS
ncbi:MAG: hypothetical protein HYX66_08970 [Ignavibacteria bacterium]|nr:hypothetical protein [Ignavibacteria bacterium]